MSNVRAWADWYIREGLVAIPLPYQTKEVTLKNWPLETLDSARAAFEERFPDNKLQNISVVLGEASGDLVDIDLDCPEARMLAPYFLKPTRTFGRATNKQSHWIYFVEGVKTEQLKDPSNTDDDVKGVILEIRSNNKSGKGGAQTVFPPSVHKDTGEVIGFTEPLLPITKLEIKDLVRDAKLLAAASILARYWTGPGTHHEASLAVSGMLLKGGCTIEEVTKIVVGIAVATGDDDEWDREQTVLSTATALEEGRDDIVGAGRLEELGVPKLVLRTVKKWICTPSSNESASAKMFDVRDGLHPATDLGNAKRFAMQHGHEVHYVVEWKKWIVWTGTHWQKSEIRPRQFAEATAKSIFNEAKSVEAAGNADYAKMLREWAKYSQSARALSDLMKTAQTQPGIAISAKLLDVDNWLIPCPNGTLDLRTATLKEPDREDLLTHLCPTPFDPDAKSPLWDKITLQMMNGDQEVHNYLQLLTGYTFSGCVRKEIMLLLYGLGGNGKSTFLRTLQHVFGEEHTCVVPSDVLMTKQGSAHPTGLTIMHGKRLAMTIEPEVNKRLAEGLVKSITGGDKISARRMGEDFWEYLPRHTIWLSTNHKPTIIGNDRGIWRRIIPIPFEMNFAALGFEDDQLSEKLKLEARGILRWVAEAAAAFYACPELLDLNNLPTRMQAFKEAYKAEQDRLGAFMEDCVEHVPGHRTETNIVWRTYQSYCNDAGMEPIGQVLFFRMLGERGFGGVRDARARYRENLKLVGGTAAVIKAFFRPTIIPGGKKDDKQ